MFVIEISFSEKQGFLNASIADVAVNEVSQGYMHYETITWKRCKLSKGNSLQNHKYLILHRVTACYCYQYKTMAVMQKEKQK